MEKTDLLLKKNADALYNFCFYCTLYVPFCPVCLCMQRTCALKMSLHFLCFSVCVCVCAHAFCTFEAPLFDVNYLSWKGNVRAQEPQCCSHLCPLMIGQRLSRPNHECLCHGIHTQSCTQEEIFSMTFYCGEWTVQTTPTAFVGCSSDALLLRGWMDGCQAEVNASPLSITHLLL